MLGNASCFFVGQTGINIYVKRAWLINAHMACGEPLCLRSLADHGTFLSCCFCPQTFADSIHPGSMTWFLPVSSAPVSALPVSGTRKPFNLQLSCRSSKEKSLFKFPTRFLSGLFVFFLLVCLPPLYISQTLIIWPCMYCKYCMYIFSMCGFSFHSTLYYPHWSMLADHVFYFLIIQWIFVNLLPTQKLQH